MPSENLECSECDRGTEYLIILIKLIFNVDIITVNISAESLSTQLFTLGNLLFSLEVIIASFSLLLVFQIPITD